MKDEYIRKQDAIDAIHCDIKITGRENAETVCKTIESFTDGIKSLEPADVVPVVRCKNCKHVNCRIYHGWQEPIYTCTRLRSRWNTDNDLEVNPNGFCSYGERKE